jgi:hypothetical protein
MNQDRAEEYLQSGQALDAQRLPWDSLWQELAEVVHPRRALVTKAAGPGAPDRKEISAAFDGTAMRANRILANGQAARITPMGARWFALRPPEDIAEHPAARRWYQQCAEILARKLSASNFYNRAHEHYLDRGAFGTAATEIVGGKGGVGLHFRSFSIGSFSIAHDEQDEVDTLTRTFVRTPKQLLQAYGEEALPASVLTALAEPSKAATEQLRVRHTIRPRLDRDPRKADSKNKPFESVHILESERHILAEGGFDEFPIACSRWELWGESPYGWAPSYLALPEATQANFIEQMLDTLAEVAAFPRVLYAASLKGDIDFRALGLTCWDPSMGGAESMPREWLTGGRYDVGKDRAADKRRAIEEAFYVPLFNAISNLDRDATATEVRAIVHESRELFHPIFANTIREFLSPLIRRAFSLLLRQGEFPVPPAAVIDHARQRGGVLQDPAVEYTSAMALALEQSQLANFADVLGVLSPLAAADPTVFDFLDMDAIGPAFMRAKGLPAEFSRTPEAIAEMRAGRAQAAEAQAAVDASAAVKNLGGAQGINDLSSLATP